MEAPEKLYYIGDDSLVLDPFPVLYLLSTEKYDNEVEYIRKDAFIKKACEFLFDNYHGEKLSLRMIEDFKKYMEE